MPSLVSPAFDLPPQSSLHLSSPPDLKQHNTHTSTYFEQTTDTRSDLCEKEEKGWLNVMWLQVRSTLTSKTLQPIDMESVVVEPVTSAKNLEFFNQASNCSTPSSSSPADDSGQPKIGLGSGGDSTMVLECGTVRITGTKIRGRLSKEEKGKMKLEENNSSSNGVTAAELQREI
ncbi:hypothetical protein BUALT_BualtUnG0011900 [Buddleja alternifolia]|uniref:Uncharacterized protein n=1 Tax=Buddleja alternifolia TaxID=168488 RepID=A0AAV6W165_9LAMI|nr:hypothetical protein BUALT_BualtUnG0011900 [Buddleja alternifolia]